MSAERVVREILAGGARGPTRPDERCLRTEEEEDGVLGAGAGAGADAGLGNSKLGWRGGLGSLTALSERGGLRPEAVKVKCGVDVEVSRGRLLGGELGMLGPGEPMPVGSLNCLCWRFVGSWFLGWDTQESGRGMVRMSSFMSLS